MTLLGGSAATWPLSARAQQGAMPVIGFLCSGASVSDAPRIAAVQRGLAESGYVVGRNAAAEYRWEEGQNDRLRALAIDLAGHSVAVIVTEPEPETVPISIAVPRLSTADASWISVLSEAVQVIPDMSSPSTMNGI